MSNKKLDVLHKNGTYYVNVSYHTAYRNSAENIFINDKPSTLCEGTGATGHGKCWVKCLEEIKSIKVQIPNKKTPSHYQLKSELSQLQKFEAIMSIEDYNSLPDVYDEYGDEYQNPMHNFYNLVYTEPSTTHSYEELEFEIIDMDAEPCDLPNYIKVDFPYNIEYQDLVWHKYPCSINYKDVYKIVVPKIIACARQFPERYKITEYSNIQSLTIYEKFCVEGRKDIDMDVISLGGESKNCKIRTGTIRAENYNELQKKLDEYTQQFLDMLDVPKYKLVKCD